MQEQSRKSSRHSSGSSGDGDPLGLIISHTNSNTLTVPKFRRSSGGSTPTDTGDGGVYIAGKSINCSSNRFISYLEGSSIANVRGVIYLSVQCI